MDARVCDCGRSIEVSSHGRPRKFCTECRPPRYERVEPKTVGCPCGALIDGRAGRKYCSDSCRFRFRVPSLLARCSECGDAVHRSQSSAAVQVCRSCRGMKHGTGYRYRSGCRCGNCKRAHADELRTYARRRVAEGRPLVRTVVERECDECGVSYQARPGAQFCSRECAKRSQGWDGVERARFRPSADLRRRVMARDGGVCQLCFAPVREDADKSHPRYPHLDHIVPRSRGGSDDESNLRLACAQCNVTRGARMDWEPEVVYERPVGDVALVV